MAAENNVLITMIAHTTDGNEKVPGVFYRTGCHKAGEPVYSGHNEHMVVDPACFPLGMQVMVNGALNDLNCDGRWS